MSKVEDQRLAILTLDFGPGDIRPTPGRDTLSHREMPEELALTPALSGSTELAEVHPRRTGEGMARSETGHVRDRVPTINH